MPRPKGEPKSRLNLDLADSVHAQIEELQKKLGADSKTEVIRRGVRLLERVQLAADDGARVVVRRDDGTESEILLA